MVENGAEERWTIGDVVLVGGAIFAVASLIGTLFWIEHTSYINMERLERRATDMAYGLVKHYCAEKGLDGSHSAISTPISGSGQEEDAIFFQCVDKDGRPINVEVPVEWRK